jgi:hypothetical protein
MFIISLYFGLLEKKIGVSNTLYNNSKLIINDVVPEVQ